MDATRELYLAQKLKRTRLDDPFEIRRAKFLLNDLVKACNEIQIKEQGSYLDINGANQKVDVPATLNDYYQLIDLQWKLVQNYKPNYKFN